MDCRFTCATLSSPRRRAAAVDSRERRARRRPCVEDDAATGRVTTPSSSSTRRITTVGRVSSPSAARAGVSATALPVAAEPRPASQLTPTAATSIGSSAAANATNEQKAREAETTATWGGHHNRRGRPTAAAIGVLTPCDRGTGSVEGRAEADIASAPRAHHPAHKRSPPGAGHQQPPGAQDEGRRLCPGRGHHHRLRRQ